MSRNIKWLLIGLMLGIVATAIIGIVVKGWLWSRKDVVGSIKVGKIWTQIAAGSGHSIAIDSDNDMWGWGLNDLGQLGPNHKYMVYYAPTELPIPREQWKQVACGNCHTMAIDSAGYLRAWGLNEFGQLGLGNILRTPTSSHTKRSYIDSPELLGDDIATPGVDDTVHQWNAVAGGYAHTVAIRADGTLWAWGLNNSGQLGIGADPITQSSPAQVGKDTDWKQVASQWWYTLAIKTDGTLWAWGDNLRGQLGLGDTINRNFPIQVETSTNWRQVSSGCEHTMAIKTDDTLWAWGNNKDGQLGLGDTITRTSPTQVGKATNWKQVICGANYTLAVKTNGTLWAWGDNKNSQLGFGDTAYGKSLVLSPVQVGADNDWKQVACSDTHTLAIKTNGTLWGWGWNGDGQLGLGDTTDRTTPTQIVNPSTLNRVK